MAPCSPRIESPNRKHEPSRNRTRIPLRDSFLRLEDRRRSRKTSVLPRNLLLRPCVCAVVLGCVSCVFQVFSFCLSSCVSPASGVSCVFFRESTFGTVNCFTGVAASRALPNSRHGGMTTSYPHAGTCYGCPSFAASPLSSRGWDRLALLSALRRLVPAKAVNGFFFHHRALFSGR